MLLCQDTRFLILQNSERSRTPVLQRKICTMLELMKILKFCWCQQRNRLQVPFTLQSSSKGRFPCPIATKCGINQSQVTSGSNYIQFRAVLFLYENANQAWKICWRQQRLMSEQLFWVKKKFRSCWTFQPSFTSNRGFLRIRGFPHPPHTRKRGMEIPHPE